MPISKLRAKIEYLGKLRNFIVVLVYALFLTVLMIVILWLVKFMIASAVAGETNHVEYKQPTLTSISLAYSNLIVYFNMYALPTLSVFIATPMLVLFIPTVTRCKRFSAEKYTSHL